MKYHSKFCVLYKGWQFSPKFDSCLFIWISLAKTYLFFSSLASLGELNFKSSLFSYMWPLKMILTVSSVSTDAQASPATLGSMEKAGLGSAGLQMPALPPTGPDQFLS